MFLSKTPLAVAAVAALSLAACGQPAEAPANAPAAGAPAPAPAAPAPVPGQIGPLARATPSASSLTITPEGTQWRASFTAGACTVQAVGARNGDRITAPVVVGGTVTAETLGADVPSLMVTITPTGASVNDAGAGERYCGAGADLDGTYAAG